MPVTILIAEDHDAVRRALHEWLKVLIPQCIVIEAASGEEAIALSKARAPQLVLMDIGLPQMNGIEATRRIKATVPKAQVVILTIHEDDAYFADAAAAGVSAYIPKRTMQMELLPTLMALLRNGDAS